MPQLNQLALVAYSQFFWLAVVLGLIYFVIGKGMLPKIQSTVDARDKSIADDLAAADAARTEADAVEEAYRARMDASRGEAAKLTAKAKADSAATTEKIWRNRRLARRPAGRGARPHPQRTRCGGQGYRRRRGRAGEGYRRQGRQAGRQPRRFGQSGEDGDEQCLTCYWPPSRRMAKLLRSRPCLAS